LVIDVVLVHGTTQSPLGWEPLVTALGELGHRCHQVDLKTVRSDEDASGFALAVVDQVASLRPVVVAHSGSGLLLGAIAEAMEARHQVFLAALIPDGAHSLTDEVQRRAHEMFNPTWLGQDPVADAVAAREFLFHDCDEATVLWALTTLRLFHPARRSTTKSCRSTRGRRRR